MIVAPLKTNGMLVALAADEGSHYTTLPVPSNNNLKYVIVVSYFEKKNGF
jgi:hypothetical protein